MSDINPSDMKTPMMQQYFEIKKEFPDCLLLYRMGDFYEMFMEDAEIGAKALDITLTARNKGSDGKIPMCGVPFHSIDQYLVRLVQQGFKAAICEQVSKPTPGKDLVQRRVVRIVTPGTVIDENMLDKSKNNYLLTFTEDSRSIVFAYADISTGVLNVFKLPKKDPVELEVLRSEIKKISPTEIIIDEIQYNTDSILEVLSSIEGININHHKFQEVDIRNYVQRLRNYFEINSLGIFQLDESDSISLQAIARILEYSEYTQKIDRKNYSKINVVNNNEFMKLDSESIQNLEIFRSNRTFSNAKEATFINLIDKTQTSMGARKLREWIIKPLISKSMIEDRLNAVNEFSINHKIRNSVEENLKKVNDIQRLASKLISGTGNARDAKNLSQSLLNSLSALEVVKDNKQLTNSLPAIKELNEQNINELITKIEGTIVDEPPFTIREGGMIRTGVDTELDNIKTTVEGSKFWIENLETTEKQSTGISTLKVGFNSVFGYYIEITKSNLHLVPNHYHRKQTLVNAERFITQELKEKEDVVLGAKEKTDEIEFRIFGELVKFIYTYISDIYTISNLIAELDCLVGLSELALQKNYAKPEILNMDKFAMDIRDGRHPVVETVVNLGNFVPNSIQMDERNSLHLITGPNMAGKSTYIRQVALIQILAQIGSFVPATSAKISIVDAIYTRIGAGDALAQGLSTFMVEMIETAKILHNATQNSLIILDEVGRGTSTTDGLSIAQSVVEYIHNKIGAKTLFATHFHELIDLEQRLKKLKNYHVGITEREGAIKFLHVVEKGGTDKSYGIEVAKLAGVPEEVISRAKEILNKNTTNQLKLSL